MKKKLLLLVLILILLFGGCGTETTGKTFKYDIPGPVENLDPQYVTDPTARLIISNIFEGLLVAAPDGSLRLGVAESYTLSSDGRTYTFTLRENTSWWDNGKGNQLEPVTSYDFAFALKRIFTPNAFSPYVDDFLSIENASQVLAGQASPDQLGIETPDARTLRITLENPDSLFLESLASTAAMPCSESFFVETHGKYGLNLSFVRSNGPFRLQRWENEKYIFLTQNQNYSGEDPVLAGGVNLYIGRGDPVERFLSGDTDLARLNGKQQLSMKDNENVVPIEKTVWCIVMNQKNTALGNPLIRQGLAYAVDRSQLEGHLSHGLTPTSFLIPPAMRILGQPYRELADNTPPLAFDPQRGKELFNRGLATLELTSLPTTTLYVPQTDNHALYLGHIQQNWQKHLSAFINIQRTTAHDIEQKLASGDYQMLLMPFSPANPRIDSLLSVFTSRSSRNYFGYQSSVYDMMLESTALSNDAQSFAAAYSRSEKLLLSDAVVIPVYSEASYFNMGKTVSGIEILPFGGHIYFKYAEKSK